MHLTVALRWAAVLAVLVVAPLSQAKVDDVQKVDDRITRVFHRLVSLQNKIEERKSSPKVQKIHSLLNRLDDLDDSQCEHENHVTCGHRSHECVSALLLCDGHKDCVNGEDERSCEFPVHKGDTYRGVSVYDTCTKRRPYEIFVTFENVHVEEFHPSFPEVDISLRIEYSNDDVDGEVSLTLHGLYNYGSHAVSFEAPEGDGLHLTADFDGVHFDRFIGVVHTSDDEACAKFSFEKYEEFH